MNEKIKKYIAIGIIGLLIISTCFFGITTCRNNRTLAANLVTITRLGDSNIELTKRNQQIIDSNRFLESGIEELSQQIGSLTNELRKIETRVEEAKTIAQSAARNLARAKTTVRGIIKAVQDIIKAINHI